MNGFRRLLLTAVLVLIGTSTAIGQELAPRPGQLAVIGADNNVYLIAADGSSHALTSDAGRSGDTFRFYQWPVWSQAGVLGFFGAQVERPNTVILETWVSREGRAPEQVNAAEDETLTYAYWTPSPCARGGDCDSIAALVGRRGESGFALRLIPADGTRAQELGQGSPFYFDWSPDGAQMAWHRDNARIELVDSASGSVQEPLAARPGAMTAPAYSPDGDTLLYGALDESGMTTSLTLTDSNVDRVLAGGLEGVVSYAWSPDGGAIAYMEQGGPLIVIDATTGNERARSVVSGIFAFFWSPLGDRLAYVPLEAQPLGTFSAKRAVPLAQQTELPRLAWYVLDAADGRSERLASFVPTREQAYLLTYFDQFGLSHRVWSPDGTRIAYGETLAGNRPVVQMIDLSRPGAPPQIVAQGVIGIWSFE